MALAPKLAALLSPSLGLAALLERFGAGEVIADDDRAVLKMHAAATANRCKLTAALGMSPGPCCSATIREAPANVVDTGHVGSSQEPRANGGPAYSLAANP